MHSQRGNSSVGRARPCQGRGREFKSRFPLHKDDSKGHPFFVAGRVGRPGRVGLRGRVSVPPPRAVPQPVFNRHQIDLRPVFGTEPTSTTISEPSPRGEGVIYRVFGTATLPTGTSVASSRGEEELPTGLRHGDHAHRYSRGIPSWRRGSSDRSSARLPCPQVLQCHLCVAKRHQTDT